MAGRQKVAHVLRGLVPVPGFVGFFRLYHVVQGYVVLASHDVLELAEQPLHVRVEHQPLKPGKFLELLGALGLFFDLFGAFAFRRFGIDLLLEGCFEGWHGIFIAFYRGI